MGCFMLNALKSIKFYLVLKFLLFVHFVKATDAEAEKEMYKGIAVGILQVTGH